MTGALRRLAGGSGLALLAVLVNIGLFGLAGFLTSTARPPRDISDPIAVSLVSLAPPEPPRQEQVPDPEPPPPEAKPDFQPDLVQPALPGAGVADFAVKIDLGDLGRDERQDDFIFDSMDLDQAPQAMVRVPPDYPYGARERGLEGYVAVKFLVREDGSVGNVNVLKAKPEGMFEDAVRRALPRWTFQPGRIGGNPVASWVVTTIRFDLN
ncbi:MAG: energy transducer TonB [Candidatus Krumholzibacteriia bacterium]